MIILGSGVSSGSTETVILSDTFTGGTLDTGKWAATVFGTATVTQSDELICTIPAAQWYARVKSLATIPTSGTVRVEVDWTPGGVYSGATGRPYMNIIPASPTREATYGFPDGYPVVRFGQSSDTTNRTRIFIGTANSYGETGTYTSGTWLGSTQYAIKWETNWTSKQMSLWVDDVLKIDAQTFIYTATGTHYLELANCDYGGVAGIEKFDNLVVTHIS